MNDNKPNSTNARPGFRLSLPPLDGATAAWILDFCGQLQSTLMLRYGDEIEAYWTATDPEQLIYVPLHSLDRKR